MPAARRRTDNTGRRLAFAFSIALAALLTLITIVACSYSAANDGHVLPGVSINGVNVAGLDRAAAEAKLRAELPPVDDGTLTVQVGSVEQNIAYADLQRDYDLEAIVDQALAYGHDGNPVELFAEQLRTLFGATIVELTPAVTYDADELARRVDAIIAQVQSAPVNATITFDDGDYVLTPATDGRALDGAAVLAQATAVIVSGNPADATITVDAQVITADVDTAAAQAAIDQAQAVSSTALTLTVGHDDFTVDVATLHAWVTLEQTAPGQWTLTIDQDAVEALVSDIKTQVDRTAVDAQVHLNDSGQASLVPSENGRVVDAGAATDAIIATLNGRSQGIAGDVVALPVVTTRPDVTTAEAQASLDNLPTGNGNGNRVLLGSWKTKYIPSPLNAEGINIRRPAQLINGTVVQPGQRFSFVGTAGPITEGNGYSEGAAIIHGKTKAEGVLGGGLCSASTTMFNAALRAGLQLGARSNHAYYISRYPVGLDATIWISGNSTRDMSFTNDSGHPIVIKAINKRRSVTFQIWGVSDGRTVELSDPVVTEEKPGAEYYEYTDLLAPGETKRVEYKADGFKSVVVRTVRDANGQIIHQDTIRSSYRMVNGITQLGRHPDDPVAGTRFLVGGEPPPPGPTEPPPTEPPPTEPPPVANFSWGPQDGITLAITFEDTSTGNPTSWLWNFGDGKPDSTDHNPTHPYDAPGTYTVTLTASNGTDPPYSVPKTITIP